MRIKFSRFEPIIELCQDAVEVVEVNERTLFSRIVLSLQSELGERALEPYHCFDGNRTVSPKGKFLLLDNLPLLPIGDRNLEKALHQKVAEEVDNILIEEGGSDIEELGHRLHGAIEMVDLNLWGKYDFKVNWDLATFLKSFGYGVHYDEAESLLERCIRFFGLCVDIGFEKPLIAVNLKSFLSQNELSELYEQAFFHGIQLCLLESWHDDKLLKHERKTALSSCFSIE